MSEKKTQREGISTVISVKHFTDLVGKVMAAKNKISEGVSTLGGLISAAANEQHLHKGAFGWFIKLKRMDPQKAAEWLFHFDTYRERGKLDQDDMLPDRKRAAPTEPDDAAEPEQQAAPPEDDPRPQFLKDRTAEAEASISAAADKTGKKTLN